MKGRPHLEQKWGFETIEAGDINGDYQVNFKDFAFMAFHWLEEY